MRTQEYLSNYIAECCRQNLSEAKQDVYKANSVLLANINDIAETLSELMLICGIHQCKAKAFTDVVTDSFLSYDEIQFNINEPARKRLCKEDLIHDLGRKCVMKRSEANLTYSVLKRAFRAFYNESNDRFNLWMHAARHMAKVLFSFTHTNDYKPEIRCVYQLLYNRLQTRINRAIDAIKGNRSGCGASAAIPTSPLISKFPNSGTLGQVKGCSFGNSKDKIKMIYSMQKDEKVRKTNEEERIGYLNLNTNIQCHYLHSSLAAVKDVDADDDTSIIVDINDSEAIDTDTNEISATDDDSYYTPEGSHDDELFYIARKSISRQYLCHKDDMPKNNIAAAKYVINCSKPQQDIVYTEEDTDESDHFDIDNTIRGSSLTLMPNRTKVVSKSYLKQCLQKSFANYLFKESNIKNFPKESNSQVCPNSQKCPVEATPHCSKAATQIMQYSSNQVTSEDPKCSTSSKSTINLNRICSKCNNRLLVLSCDINPQADKIIESENNKIREHGHQWWIPLEKDKSRESATLKLLMFHKRIEKPTWNNQGNGSPFQWWVPLSKENTKFESSEGNQEIQTSSSNQLLLSIRANSSQQSNQEFPSNQPSSSHQSNSSNQANLSHPTNQANPSNQPNLSHKPNSSLHSNPSNLSHQQISSHYSCHTNPSIQPRASNQANQSIQTNLSNPATVSCNRLSCENLKRSMVNLGNQANIIESENYSLDSWNSSTTGTDTDPEYNGNITSKAAYETRADNEDL